MAKREFTVKDEYPYNHSGPVRWIISHMRRYPLYPLVAVGAALANNMAYSSIAVATETPHSISTRKTPNSSQIAMAQRRPGQNR